MKKTILAVSTALLMNFANAQSEPSQTFLNAVDSFKAKTIAWNSATDSVNKSNIQVQLYASINYLLNLPDFENEFSNFSRSQTQQQAYGDQFPCIVQAIIGFVGCVSGYPEDWFDCLKYYLKEFISCLLWDLL